MTGTTKIRKGDAAKTPFIKQIDGESGDVKQVIIPTNTRVGLEPSDGTQLTAVNRIVVLGSESTSTFLGGLNVSGTLNAPGLTFTDLSVNSLTASVGILSDFIEVGILSASTGMNIAGEGLGVNTVTASAGIDADHITVDTLTASIGISSTFAEIGTNISPAAAHANADNLVVGNALSNGGMTIQGSLSGLSSIYFADSDNDVGQIVYNHTDDDMGFTVGTTEMMVLNTTGLTIGTQTTADAAAGADDLVVGNTTTSTGITIFSLDTGLGTLAFGDTANNNIGRIEYDHNNTEMNFATGDSTRMTLTNTELDITSIDLHAYVKQQFYFYAAFTSMPSTQTRYMPAYSTGGGSTTLGAIHEIHPTRDGVITVLQAAWDQSSTSSASWTIGIVINGVTQTTEVFSLTDGDVDATAVNVTFSAGDKVAISFSPSATETGTLTVAIEYEILTNSSLKV